MKKINVFFALNICLLFINISLINFFYSSSLHINNKNIRTIPSTSDIILLNWDSIWGGSDFSKGCGIAFDSSENIFIIGDSLGNLLTDVDGFDVILLKYNSEGALLWDTTWRGSSDDSGTGIAIDGSGNVFITGITGSYGAGNDDVLLLKYDSEGNLLWNTTWGGSSDDKGNGIVIDSSGNLFVTGITGSYGAGNDDVLLLKYDSEGNLLWGTTWGSSEWDLGRGITIDSSGNIFITGSIGSYGAGNDDILLLKYDSNGNLLWNTTWGNNYDEYGYGIAIDSSGNLFVTGITGSYGAGNDDVLLLKYDSEGNLLWNATWGSSELDQGRGIGVDDSGNAFITGITDSFGAGSYDVLLLKYDSEGSLLWNATWGGFSDDQGYGIGVDKSGNIFVTGYTYSFALGGADAFLSKYGIDTDEDGLTDDEEVNIYFTDPNNSDTDEDGLTDDEEVNIYFTDPNNSDTDEDGLTDDEEVNIYFTDPNDSDTDGDGMNDGNEIDLGFDPTNPFSNLFIILLSIIILIVIVSVILLFIVLHKKIKKKMLI